MQLLVYSGSLLVTILSLILSLYSLQAPTWIRFDTPAGSPLAFSSTYGLTQKCDRSNLHPAFECRRFPDLGRDCSPPPAQLHPSNGTSHGHMAPLGGGTVRVDEDGRAGFGFCEQWNTAAYTAQLSVVVGVLNIFSTFVILLGNSYRHAHGWKICAGLLAIHAFFQSVAWILIVNVFNQDGRFYFGSRLSTATYVSIATTIVDLLLLTALVAAGFTGIFASSSSTAAQDRSDYERIQ
ncbi:hypothetical protein PTTG_00613 [Puccinia triticina 1-1 BBBD Race 1]|uniref:Uncharacterized protein n=2 Tax=Puccinia triticina TaxID=208348 RepID=A0A180GND3_PUCT1|nr:uncharacterized protein PtA15_8A171 [Puccinia triticina]OAV94230.1 hypothetical protein PTTG_00613 [Puccinia triticina 1-1 BBBD Race 1]WAQ87267.1 hypothetical protein PtA15_8A171 [Puccinia triticina]WAR57120.1 hypothetical protein PtB15_8B166 [Puccinia triticina]